MTLLIYSFSHLIAYVTVYTGELKIHKQYPTLNWICLNG